MKVYLLPLFLLILSPTAFSQQSYFQQEVNYKIQVKLNDSFHTLSAFEEIEYINNSPDTLHFIYFHLWPNAYKNNQTALGKQLYENGELDFYYAEDKNRGFIDSLDFKVDNTPISWQIDNENIDIALLKLNNPLPPGNKIIITTPFFVKIPLGIYSRLGHMGESYQITQWYPKPAVYDKKGWHQMPYLTQGEFFSEFGSFDVSITLPKNYVLGATGDMVDAEEELAWLNQKVEETKLIEAYDKTMDFPPSSKEWKTIRFKQTNVHDFAWFADKRYHVLKGEVELPNSKEMVTTWAMYTNSEPKLWKKSIEYLNDALYYYSLWNGDYPYKHCTAVDGALSAGAGMEYPNITVIGKSGTAFMLETVIMHEVGHNWFYGILGSNERIHPWMDEGLNSFNENRYIETKYPTASLLGIDDNEKVNSIFSFFDLEHLLHKDQYYLGYVFGARKNTDQPIELPANEYTNFNYGSIVYGKSALVFDYLMAYLGEETMDKAMQQYFQKWKFKHPYPEDLKAVLEEVSGKNLDWFFDNLINATYKLDYKIVGIKKQDNQTLLKVKNSGNFSAPFSVSAIKNDSIIQTVWHDGTDKKTEVVFNVLDADKYKIDATDDMPEIRRKNNTIKTKGTFKKIEPFRLQYLASLENPNKTQLFFTPIIGWNNADKTMLGLSFYNAFIPQKRFEYVLARMFSIASKKVVGSGFLKYHFMPISNVVKQISVGVAGQQYSYLNTNTTHAQFAKITPSLDIIFNKKRERSVFNHMVTLKAIYIQEQTDFSGFLFSQNKSFAQLIYNLSNTNTLKPYSVFLRAEATDDFAKMSIESNFRFKFKKDKKSLDIRIFAGSFLFNQTNNARYNWRMDNQSGMNDYTYEYVMLDRSKLDPVLGNQFALSHGGFKVPTPVGQSNLWIAAANMKFDIPIGLPIGLFADIGVNHTGVPNYDVGIYLPLAKDIFEIYFPLYYSNDIQQAIAANNLKYGNLIRFTLHLEKINPFEIISSIKL
jgi:hypothetical protein